MQVNPSTLQENKPQPSLFTFFLFNGVYSTKFELPWDSDGLWSPESSIIWRGRSQENAEFTLKWE